MKVKSKFLNSREWKDLVSETNPRLQGAKADGLILKLDTASIASLISLLGIGSTEEVQLALYLLKKLILTGRLPKEQTEKLLTSLKSLMAEYPSNTSHQAFHLINMLAPEQAEQILLAMDSTMIPDEMYSSFYLKLFGLFRTLAIVDRLTKLSEVEGWKGKAAQEMLARRGITDPREVQSLARKWKESVSSKYLGPLYETYVQHYHGKPIASLIDLLGFPTTHEGRSYTYSTKEGNTLVLQCDEDDNLKTARFK